MYLRLPTERMWGMVGTNASLVSLVLPCWTYSTPLVPPFKDTQPRLGLK